MKSIDEFSRAGLNWLNGAGPLHDVVISSRIRLARNLAGFTFLTRTDESDRCRIHRLLLEKIAATDFGGNMVFFDIDETAALDRQVLVERHLISRQHADGEGSRGVAVTQQESMALMINEEDHLRIQVMRGGLQLEALWTDIDAIDDALQEHVDFAFHPQFGFLTACPTNVGTGIRVSVMLHLPGLKLTGELEKVSRAARDMRLAIRGLHGEGSEATGDFYQVSNQTTLGKTELEVIREFCDVVIPKIVAYERLAREVLINERSPALDDKIWRALGVLENARTMSTEETLLLLSHLRMGVHLKRLSKVSLEVINDLFIKSQPAHLQKLEGGVLDGEARSIARADLIRKSLTSNN